jgi:hypothetical protein
MTEVGRPRSVIRPLSSVIWTHDPSAPRRAVSAGTLSFNKRSKFDFDRARSRERINGQRASRIRPLFSNHPGGICLRVAHQPRPVGNGFPSHEIWHRPFAAIPIRNTSTDRPPTLDQPQVAKANFEHLIPGNKIVEQNTVSQCDSGSEKISKQYPTCSPCTRHHTSCIPAVAKRNQEDRAFGVRESHSIGP